MLSFIRKNQSVFYRRVSVAVFAQSFTGNIPKHLQNLEEQHSIRFEPVPKDLNDLLEAAKGRSLTDQLRVYAEVLPEYRDVINEFIRLIEDNNAQLAGEHDIARLEELAETLSAGTAHSKSRLDKITEGSTRDGKDAVLNDIKALVTNISQNQANHIQDHIDIQRLVGEQASELDVLRERVRALEAQVQGLEDEVSRLSRKPSQTTTGTQTELEMVAKADLDEMTEERDLALAAKATAEDLLRQSEDKLKESEAARATLRERNTERQDRIGYLTPFETQAHTLGKENLKLQRQLRALEGKLRTQGQALEAAGSATQGQLEELQAKLDAALADVDRANKATTEAKEENTRLVSKHDEALSAKDKTIKSLEVQIAALRAQLAQQGDAKDANDALQRQIDELQAKLDQATARIQVLEAENAELKAENGKLQQQLEAQAASHADAMREKEKEMEALKAELEALRQQSAAERDALLAKLKTANQMSATYGKRADDIQRVSNERHQKQADLIQNLSKQLEDKIEQNVRLEHQVTKGAEIAAEAQAHIEDIEAKLKAAQDNVLALEARIAREGEAAETTQKELAAANAELAAKLADYDKIFQTLSGQLESSRGTTPKAAASQDAAKSPRKKEQLTAAIEMAKVLKAQVEPEELPAKLQERLDELAELKAQIVALRKTADQLSQKDVQQQARISELNGELGKVRGKCQSAFAEIRKLRERHMSAALLIDRETTDVMGIIENAPTIAATITTGMGISDGVVQYLDSLVPEEFVVPFVDAVIRDSRERHDRTVRGRDANWMANASLRHYVLGKENYPADPDAGDFTWSDVVKDPHPKVSNPCPKQGRFVDIVNYFYNALRVAKGMGPLPQGQNSPQVEILWKSAKNVRAASGRQHISLLEIILALDYIRNNAKGLPSRSEHLRGQITYQADHTPGRGTVRFKPAPANGGESPKSKFRTVAAAATAGRKMKKKKR